MLIVFSEEDDDSIQFLHDDSIDVTLIIKNYNIYHVLIDNGSSVNFLYFDELLKTGMSLE